MEGVEKLKANIADIDVQIADLTSKLSEIEHSRDSILECVSGSMFEQMSEELKALNKEEYDIAKLIDDLTRQKEDNKRSILKADSAVELFKGMKKVDTFDENVVGRLVDKIEAIGKDKIAVTFCGGFRVEQGIISR